MRNVNLFLALVFAVLAHCICTESPIGISAIIWWVGFGVGVTPTRIVFRIRFSSAHPFCHDAISLFLGLGAGHLLALCFGLSVAMTGVFGLDIFRPVQLSGKYLTSVMDATANATVVISVVVHHDDDLVSRVFFPILDINDLCPCGLQSLLSWDDSFAMHLLCNLFHPIPWRLRILFTILPCCTMRHLLSPVMAILLLNFGDHDGAQPQFYPCSPLYNAILVDSLVSPSAMLGFMFVDWVCAYCFPMCLRTLVG